MIGRLISFLLGVLVGAIAVFFFVKIGPPGPQTVPGPAVTPQAPAAVTTPAEQARIEPPRVEAPAQSALPSVATSSSSEQLVMPVKGIAPGQLTDTYSQKRGSDRIHEALDIMAPRGTEVVAAVDGKIVKLFNSKPGGLTIYQFDRDARYAYYYAHLDRYAHGIVEGKEVVRGELLGYVGTTGNADPSAPHLHFAIFELGAEKRWWEGRPINPYPLLSGANAPVGP